MMPCFLLEFHNSLSLVSITKKERLLHGISLKSLSEKNSSEWVTFLPVIKTFFVRE